MPQHHQQNSYATASVNPPCLHTIKNHLELTRCDELKFLSDNSRLNNILKANHPNCLTIFRDNKTRNVSLFHAF